jgi:hypothetical protein
MSTDKKGWLASIFRTPDAAVESVAAKPEGGIRTYRAPSENAPAATATRPIVAAPPKMVGSVAPPPLRAVAPPAPGARPAPIVERPCVVLGVDGTSSRKAWGASRAWAHHSCEHSRRAISTAPPPVRYRFNASA